MSAAEQLEDRALLSRVNPFTTLDDENAFDGAIGAAVKSALEFAAGGLESVLEYDNIRNIVENVVPGIDTAEPVSSVNINVGVGINLNKGVFIESSAVAFDAGFQFSYNLASGNWTISRGLELEADGLFHVGAEEFVTITDTQVIAGIKLSAEHGAEVPDLSFRGQGVTPVLTVDIGESENWTLTIDETFTTAQFLAATDQSSLAGALVSLFTPIGTSWKQQVAKLVPWELSTGLDLLGLAEFNNSPIQLLNDGVDGVPESRITSSRVASLGFGVGVGGNLSAGVGVSATAAISVGVTYEHDIIVRALNPTDGASLPAAQKGIAYSSQASDLDGDIDRARVIPLNTHIYDSISSPGDVDWYAFSLNSADTIGVTLEQAAALDAQITLYREDGTRLAFSQGGFTTDLPPGDYRFAVSSYAAHHTGDYSVALSRRQPGSSLEFSGTRSDDDDGDGLREGREKVDFDVQLENVDSGRVTNLEGVLLSSVTQLQIDPVNSIPNSWPQLDPGERAFNYGDWDLFLDADSYDNLPFVLHVTYDVNDVPYYQNLTFTRDFHPATDPSFQIVDFTIDDSASRSTDNNGDGVIQSGEDIRIAPRLRNNSNATATDVEVSLIYRGESPDTSGEVLDLEVQPEGFPDLESGSSAYPTGGSTFSLRDIREDFSGTVSFDVQILADQLAEPLLLESALQVTVTPAPWLQLSEREHSFGVAAPGSEVRHTAAVRNAGTADMTVTGFIASDADTSVNAMGLPWTLAPGESRAIEVVIDTSGIASGSTLERTVTVQSNGRIDDAHDAIVAITGLVSNEVPIFQLPSTTAQNPDISGDWIVYADSRHGNFDVFAFQISTGTELQLTTDPRDQYGPRISGDLVVWNDERNWDGTTDTRVAGVDLYGWDLSTGAELEIATDRFTERLIGVDGGMVAFSRGYYEFTERSNDEIAADIVVEARQNDGTFAQIFSSNFPVTSGHNPKGSVSRSSVDFGDGILLYRQFEIYYRTDVSVPGWRNREQHYRVLDLNSSPLTPLQVSEQVDSFGSSGVAANGGFVFTREYEDANGNEAEQVYRWTANGVERLTRPDAEEDDNGDDVLAAGDDGFIVYDRRGAANENKLFYWDQNLSGYPEFLLTQQISDAQDGRMDDGAVVFRAQSPSDNNRYIYFALLGQGEVGVTQQDISFSDQSITAGGTVDITVSVSNLNQWATSGDIGVRLYDGDPAAGGVQLGGELTISSAIPSRGQASVTFPAVVIPNYWEGEEDVYVQVLPAAIDSVSNNVAHATIHVNDSDQDGPLITSVSVAELNGDGDGVIGSDEGAKVSWAVSDASGVGTVTLWIDTDGDGLGTPASRDPDDSVLVMEGTSGVISGLTPGIYPFAIDATDADLTPEVTTKTGQFEVVASEEITVSLDSVILTDDAGAPVDFGTYSIGHTAKETVFVLTNPGNQTLTIGEIETPDGYDASLSPNRGIEPGEKALLTVSLASDTVGTFNGTVRIHNSDGSTSPDGLNESVFDIAVTGVVDTTGPTQQISASDVSAVAGSIVQIPVTYTTSDSDNTLDTLAFRLHFDESKLEFHGLTDVFQNFLIGQQVQNDVGDLDNRPETTHFILMAWADPFNGQFPNQELPLTLYTANFRVNAGLAVGDATEITFTGQSTSPDYAFRGTPATVTVAPPVSLDVDNDGAVQVASDGFLILRYMFGFTGNALIDGRLASGAQRTDPAEIVEFLDGGRDTMLDVDDDGSVQVASDGFLILRYMFGFTSDALIDGRLASGAQRTDSAEIVDFLNDYRPAPAASSQAATIETVEPAGDTAPLEAAPAALTLTSSERTAPLLALSVESPLPGTETGSAPNLTADTEPMPVPDAGLQASTRSDKDIDTELTLLLDDLFQNVTVLDETLNLT